MTISPLVARVGSPTPRVANYPAALYSEADEVIELYERYVGRRLDLWQRFVLRHGLGRRADDRWAAWKVGTWVPRQNGKGDVIMALELSWLFLPGFSVPLATHSAHLYPTAQEAFLRIKDVIEGADDLRRRLRGKPRETNGEQGFTLKTRERLRFMSRTRTGGRGFSSPRIVLDEGQELQPLMMAAALPIMSAQPDPQVWVFGTPPDDPAAWCYNLREDGEAGAEGMAWFDWGREIDLEDPEDAKRVNDVNEWYAANPAAGLRIQEWFMRGEALPSGLGANFPHERLGVWRPRAMDGDGVISAEQWRDLAEPTSPRPDSVAFSIQLNQQRTHGAIVAVGPRADGRFVISVVDHRSGTDWIAERCRKLRESHNPIAFGLDLKSPAGALLLDLQREGIDVPADPERPKRGDLVVPTAGDIATSFGMFVDTARQRGLVHLDEAPLNVAIGAAKIRALSGGSAWERKGAVDISTLDAATLALWSYVTRIEAVSSNYDALDNIW